MDPSEQISDIARRIGHLVNAATIPARRDAASLGMEAPQAKKRRRLAGADLESHVRRVQSFGWIPIIGRFIRSGLEQAQSEKDVADLEWGNILSRALAASDLLKKADVAKAITVAASRRAKYGGAMPAGMPDRVGQLLARTKFLESTAGQDIRQAPKLAKKCFFLADELDGLLRAWDSPPTSLPPAAYSERTNARPAAALPPASHNVPVQALPGRRTQMSLDFDGTGQVVEEPRIWLPVSGTRMHELKEQGARVDKTVKRGSKLWIPVSERSRLDAFLPLAFRKKATRFSFPPIRHNAAKQNLWAVFDKPSWNHIRTTVYDRAGQRCQICGKQGGGLWEKLASPEELQRNRAVECHEVWDWQEPDPETGIGIQKLERLLALCPDCHMVFHEGFALSRAKEVGLEAEAADYIKSRRMLINRYDGATLDAQLSQDRQAWEDNKAASSWVLDLSHLANQDFMADHTMVLMSDNKARVSPDQIAGIAFRTEEGADYAAVDAHSLAKGNHAQPIAAQQRFRL